MQQTLIERLRIRAAIRRQIPTRKSVQENKPDRIADLLEEAALVLEAYEDHIALHEGHKEYLERVLEELAEENRKLKGDTQ